MPKVFIQFQIANPVSRGNHLMRKSICSIAVLGVLTSLLAAGCPWSNSPNVFDESKGISLPNFGGPPPQTEPELTEDDFSENSFRVEEN